MSQIDKILDKYDSGDWVRSYPHDIDPNYGFYLQNQSRTDESIDQDNFDCQKNGNKQLSLFPKD